MVLAESYLQHAEHYQRMIVMWNEQDAARQNDQQETQDKAYSDKSENQADNDDLSLPQSILGEKIKAESEHGRASSRVLEDA
jgi:hypothetical protein